MPKCDFKKVIKISLRMLLINKKFVVTEKSIFLQRKFTGINFDEKQKQETFKKKKASLNETMAEKQKR